MIPKEYILLCFMAIYMTFSIKVNGQNIDSIQSLDLDRSEMIEWIENKLREPELNDTAIFNWNALIGDFLSKEKEHIKAINSLQNSITIGNKLKLTETPVFIDALNDLAYNLIQIGQVRTAEKYVRAHIDNDIKDWRYVKLCFYYAQCLESLGDHNLAQLHLEKALRISKGIGNERYISRSLARLSRMYLLTNSYEKAKVLDENLESYAYLNRIDQIMAVKYNIATIYKNNRFYNKAIKIFEEVIQWGAINNKVQFSLMGNINRASCLRELKLYDSAKEGFNKAILIDSTQEIIYHNLAEVFLILGDEDSAIIYNEHALKMAKIELNNYNFTDSFRVELFKFPYKEHVLIFFNDLARSHLAKAIHQSHEASLGKAATLFDLLDDMINEIRFSTTEQQSHHFWRNQVKPIYDNAILTAYLSNDIDQAFYYAEKSKAILLLDDLLKNTTANKGQVSDELLEKEFVLKQELFDIEIQLSVSIEAEEKIKLNDLLLKKKLEISDLIQEMTLVAPNYVNAKYEPPVTNLEQLKNKLKRNETIVNFIWTEEHVFRFIIDKKNVEIKKISIEEGFVEEVKQLINQLKKPVVKKDSLRSLNEKSSKVYQKLLGDAIIKSKYLTILPDGLTYYLPFEALVVNGDFDQPQYLLEEKVVNYGFSVNTTYVPYVKQRWKQAAIAFAPNQYLPEMNLAELRFSDFELEPILSSRTQLLENETASKSNLLNSLESNNIIHIYSHAEANDDRYPYPWIAAQDGLVFLPEIYNYKNQADLVVLSACETNLGKEVKGEGVLSLARGFFHAGSKSVLASLWKVNDKSNSAIVHHFYKYVKKGKSKAEAIRLSKIDFIKSHAIEGKSPYYWAGLVYIGKDGCLQIHGKNNIIKYVFLGVSILLLLAIGFKLKKANSQ